MAAQQPGAKGQPHQKKNDFDEVVLNDGFQQGRENGIEDIVQFATAIYYCEEGEGVVHLRVTRVGTLSSITVVDYTTQDGSAINGVKYKAAQGKLRFMPGEMSKMITITLV